MESGDESAECRVQTHTLHLIWELERLFLIDLSSSKGTTKKKVRQNANESMVKYTKKGTICMIIEVQGTLETTTSIKYFLSYSPLVYFWIIIDI